MALGFVICARRLRCSQNAGDVALAFLAVIWLCEPGLLWTVLRPNIYGGARHFLFVQPAIALLAGIGFEMLWLWCREKAYSGVIRVLMLAALIAPLVPICRLHPYQTEYFNALAGGTRGAQGRYDIQYWSTAYKEAIEWIKNQDARTHKTARILVQTRSLFEDPISSYMDDSTQFRLANGRTARGALPADLDYYVCMVDGRSEHNYEAAPIVFTVKRDGVALAVVKGR